MGLPQTEVGGVIIHTEKQQSGHLMLSWFARSVHLEDSMQPKHPCAFELVSTS